MTDEGQIRDVPFEKMSREDLLHVLAVRAGSFNQLSLRVAELEAEVAKLRSVAGLARPSEFHPWGDKAT